jgi:hypothetical protein
MPDLQALGQSSHRHGAPALLDADGRAVGESLTQRDVLRLSDMRLEQSCRPRGAPRRPSARPRARTSAGAPQGYRIVEPDIDREPSSTARRVVDLAWPPASLVLAIRGASRTFEPPSRRRSSPSDRLTVLVPAEHADALVDAVSRLTARDRERTPLSARR